MIHSQWPELVDVIVLARLLGRPPRQVIAWAGRRTAYVRDRLHVDRAGLADVLAWHAGVARCDVREAWFIAGPIVRALGGM